MRKLGVVMPFTKILVAHDGSELSDISLREAIAIAKWNPLLEIHVVHVGNYRLYLKEVTFAGEVKQSITIPILEHGEEIHRRIKALLTPIANPWQIFIQKGYPGQVIIQHARQYHCDLIIVGNRERSKWKRWMFGSVSWYVVQQSPVPVLLIKKLER